MVAWLGRQWPDFAKEAQRLVVKLAGQGRPERARAALALVTRRAEREFLMTKASL